MAYLIGDLPERIDLGITGENGRLTLEFDVSPWLAMYPGMTFTLAAVRPGESEVYFALTALTGNVLSWTVTGEDIGARGGFGSAEIWGLLDGVRVKTARVRTFAARSAAQETASAPGLWAEAVTEACARSALDLAACREERAGAAAYAASAAQAVSDARDVLSGKADITGAYEGLYAGTAGNLVSRGDAARQSILCRPTAGAAGNIVDGTALITAIYGNSVVSGGAFTHLCASGLRSVGFDLLDPDTGTARVLAGMEYQLTGAYDTITHSSGEELVPDENGVFTPVADGVVTVTGGAPCLHFVHSGIRNGAVAEYTAGVLALPIGDYFPDGMRSAGTAADLLTADRAVCAVAQRGLDTLNWSRSVTNGVVYWWAPVGDKYVPALSGEKNISCTGYTVTGARTSVPADGYICESRGSDRLFIRDTAADAMTRAEFKTYVTGVQLTYRLAVPVVTAVSPRLNLTYPVCDFGMEELIAPAASAPLIADIVYHPNAVDTLRNLPRNYVNTDSLDALCAALCAALDLRSERVWNAAPARWDFTFTREEDES